MSRLALSLHNAYKRSEIPVLEVPTSKSISNRLLMLQHTFNPNLNIKQLSTSDDTQLLNDLLFKIKTSNTEEIVEINAQNCGTALRFLCAFLCFQKGKYILTGSEAMKNRPIKGLVDALLSCGATISYTEKEGFPPLKITGGNSLVINEIINIDARQSSQFASAILLVLPLFKQDIRLCIQENIASFSYLNMTLTLMQQLGIDIAWKNQKIEYRYTPSAHIRQEITVESDWSAAAYWFVWAALNPDVKISIANLQKSELQGDSIIEDIVKKCGVEVRYNKEGVFLQKTTDTKPLYMDIDASNCLDLVPTFVVLCCGLKIKATIRNVGNLKYKESNRIHALISELKEITSIQHIENSLKISSFSTNNPSSLHFQTYDDHRIAMSLALLSGVFPEIYIENPSCVSKSYPTFWENIGKLGVKLRYQ
ncbi:MAG: hypothetical protein GX330_08110 [Bacteroidales bacterium]|nr:hypothetical protein [Bacteroidales bacterium]